MTASAARMYQATWGVPTTIRTAANRPPPSGMISRRGLLCLCGRLRKLSTVIPYPILPRSKPRTPGPLFESEPAQRRPVQPFRRDGSRQTADLRPSTWGARSHAPDDRRRTAGPGGPHQGALPTQLRDAGQGELRPLPARPRGPLPEEFRRPAGAIDRGPLLLLLLRI